MPLDRDQLAADIYVRLIEIHPAKTDVWRRTEAIAMAETFIRELQPPPPKSKPQRQKKEAA